MANEKLRDRAKRTLLSGRYKKALECFAELHTLEPDDLRTYVKLAELREKTGDTENAVSDYIHIAGVYAGQGLVVQAIAINKIVLRLDPERTEIKERLKTLSSERGDDWAMSTVVPQEHTQAPDSTGMDQARLSFERTPLLSGLSGDELESFIDSLQLRHVAADEAVFQAGDQGDYLYLIGMGNVLLRARDAQGRKRVFSHLCEGDFFGEHAFMSRVAYSDEAIAETDCNILMIDRATFDKWVEDYPGIQSTVEDFYRQRVLARMLAITPVFEGVPSDARLLLANHFQLRIFEKGDIVVREGEAGDTFYLIRSGSVDVSTSGMGKDEDQIALGKIGEGDFFGEVALLTDKPRTATVVACENAELMELSRADFNEITNKFPSVRKIVEAYQKQRVQNTIKILLNRKPGQ